MTNEVERIRKEYKKCIFGGTFPSKDVGILLDTLDKRDAEIKWLKHSKAELFKAALECWGSFVEANSKLLAIEETLEEAKRIRESL